MEIKTNDNRIAILLTIVLLVALIPFLVLGAYVRFQADDYCSSSLFRTQGFWNAQQSSYLYWSGRYATMFVTGVIDKLGLFGIEILPSLLILGLLGSLYSLFNNLGRYLNKSFPKSLLFCISAAVTFFTVITTPNAYQSYYWRSGSLTYTLPIIAFNILLSLLLNWSNKKARWWQIVIVFVAAFFMMGFSETNAALQLVALILGLITISIYNHSKKNKPVSLTLWITALVGGLLGCLAMILAPGNAVRISLMPDTPGFFGWLYLSLRFAIALLYHSFIDFIPARIASVLLGIGIGLSTPFNLSINEKSLLRNILIIFGVVFVLMVTCCAPSAFAESAYLEERAQTGANFALTAFLIFVGIAAGFQARIHIPPHSLKTFTLALTLLAITFIVWETISYCNTIPAVRKRAAKWDERNAYILEQKAAGNLDITVDGLDSIGFILEISPDPGKWVNQCAASFYQVNSIIASE